MKTCITCMQEKPLHCYAIEKGKHRGSCKDCRREYRKTIAHKINANNREKNRLFPEIAAEYKKKYRSNPENKIKEAEAKKRYRSSPENIARERASNAKWVEANKESIRLKSQEKYFANRLFNTLQAVVDAATAGLQALEQGLEKIKSLTQRQWMLNPV